MSDATGDFQYRHIAVPDDDDFDGAVAQATALLNEGEGIPPRYHGYKLARDLCFRRAGGGWTIGFYRRLRPLDVPA